MNKNELMQCAVNDFNLTSAFNFDCIVEFYIKGEEHYYDSSSVMLEIVREYIKTIDLSGDTVYDFLKIDKIEKVSLKKEGYEDDIKKLKRQQQGQLLIYCTEEVK